MVVRPQLRSCRKRNPVEVATQMLLMAVVLLVGACSGSTPSDGESGGGSNSGKEVTFLLGEGPEELQAFRDIVNSYNASQSDVSVTLIPVSEDEDLITRLSTDISSGNAPDIFFANYRYIDSFSSKGLLAPIDERLASAEDFTAKDFYPAALNAFKIDGTQYCMPFNASSLVVFYNEALFEQAGIEFPASDWTWKDMAEAARATTGLEPIEGGVRGEIESEEGGEADGAEEGEPPAAPPGTPPGDELTSGIGVDPQLIRVMPFVWSAGGEVADAQEHPSKFTMTSLPSQKALTAFLGLNARDNVVPSEALTQSEGLESLFANGRLAMLMESRKIVPTMRTITGFDWNVAPLPVLGDDPGSILHSDGYCITAGGSNPEEAWDFIQYAVGPEGQRVAAESGRAVPSMISVAESDAFLDPGNAPADSQVWLDQLPYTKTVPVVENWVEVEDVANAVLEEGFFEGEDAAEVGDQIDRQTKPLLRGE